MSLLNSFFALILLFGSLTHAAQNSEKEFQKYSKSYDIVWRVVRETKTKMLRAKNFEERLIELRKFDVRLRSWSKQAPKEYTSFAPQFGRVTFSVWNEFHSTYDLNLLKTLNAKEVCSRMPAALEFYRQGNLSEPTKPDENDRILIELASGFCPKT